MFEEYISNPYLRALAILVGFFIILKIFVFVIERIVLKIASKTKTELDDKIIHESRKPISFIILLFGLKIALGGISIPYLELVSKILITLIILGVFYLITRIFNLLLENWGEKLVSRTKSTLDDNLLNLAHKVIKVVMVILGLMYILSFWGVEITPLLASLGIGGIAIAFALQSTLGNIFGGVSLLIDRSVKVGDRIQLESGESGIVLDVGLRSTKIKTWNNDIIVIPNGQLSNSRVQNFLSDDRKARVVIDFGVEYGSNIDHVEKIVLKAIENIDGRLDDPTPIVEFYQMGDSALLFRAKFWVGDVGKRYSAKIASTKAIYNALNKEKIVIPFPQMDVHLKK